jgi:two-component system sensor histidine kinase SenX3
MNTYKLPSIPLRKEPFLWIGVLSILAGLLGLVAVMQYRFTTRASEAAEDRIGGNVESLMINWHLDLYQRFSAICVALQVGPDSGAFDDWSVFSDRYGQWRRTAQIPGLVQNLYIWETSRRGSPQLLRLDAGSTAPQPVVPEPGFAALLQRLQSRSSTLYSGLRAWQAMDAKRLSSRAGSRDAFLSSDSFTGWQFDQSIPALVHPIVHHRLPSDEGEPRSDEAVDWMLVALDWKTIETQILPELEKRHFEVAGKADYSVEVAALGNPNRVLYESSGNTREPKMDESDAAMDIFGPPPQSTENNFWEAVKNANAVKVQNWRHFSGPIWFPVFQYTTGQNPWMLVLTHRTGRLEDMVANVRRVNLFASGIVLLLLAASVSLVALAAHRARTFARLQMEFVASVSHELRTPLTAIYSAGENLADGVIEKKAQLQSYGFMITAQARQLIDLVDQILSFASTRSGEKHHQMRLLDVSEIFESAIENGSAMRQANGFFIEREIQPDLPLVRGDLSAITSCLQNLLVNAVKYSGSSHWIRVSARLVEDGGIRMIEISVEDRGIGIDSADLGRIFKPFYRSPRVKAAQIHGTGLGLAVAKELAEAIGGNLTVSSVLGVGSTFTLHLPVH